MSSVKDSTFFLWTHLRNLSPPGNTVLVFTVEVVSELFLKR